MGDRRSGFGLVMLLCLFLPAAAAAADLYSWVDSSGHQHIADSLAKVPEEYQGRARKLGGAGETMNFQAKPQTPAGPAATDTLQKDLNGHDEQWWRSQVKNVLQQINAEENNLVFYEERRRKCEEEQRNHLRYWTDCPRMYEESKKRAEWNIEQHKKRLEVDLPEQARKAGALPGWLRQ